MEDIVEVNGVRYQKVSPQSKVNSRSFNVIAAALAIGGVHLPSPIDKGLSDDIDFDIVEEFGKIQRKESKFTRSKRDWIEFQFNRTHKKID